MNDDRDFSWMGAPRPAEPPPVEHTLVGAHKGLRARRTSRTGHPLGHELRMLVDCGAGLLLLWSRVVKPSPGLDVVAMAEQEQAPWTARGWA